MTIHQTLTDATRQLTEAQVPDPAQDALLMLASILNKDPLSVRLDGAKEMSPDDSARYRALLLHRAKREPLQYLLREQWFYGLPFYVDNRVLIPRQETESLCEIGIQHLKKLAAPAALDLCTGSGAIAVTLKHNCPHASVSAADLSKDALSVAKENARRHLAKITFFQGDLLTPLAGKTFDLILSNPPYIETEACKTLQTEVLQEPLMALDGGDDGLDFYRRIAAGAHQHLNAGGLLAMEVGSTQAQAVADLLAAKNTYRDIAIVRDLYGLDRIVKAYKE
ncbi:MAG: peptide chain release factor N(5)-glutamine methyltransferase [Clostridiales bacterium]|nr:peptide chain release factor N(5)-glutamine methyltransferase [Clostridiales bacterium]